MNARMLSIGLVLAVGWIAGCQKSTAPDLADGDLVDDPAANSPSSLPRDAAPDEVVTAFLDAARSGNETLATQLLTRRAQEETEKEGLTLDPPGTASMKYRIEKVEYAEDLTDAAYVNSVWTDSGALIEDPFEVVWVLRRQSEGWRIAGMAAQMEPGEPAVFLNFEQPDDLLRLKGQIDAEPSREQSGSVRQASYVEPVGPAPAP